LRPRRNVIEISSQMMRAPDSSRATKILKKRAGELQQWSSKRDSVRNYAIEIHLATQKSITTTWRVGFLLVYCGALRSDNSIVLRERRGRPAGHSLSSKELIDSKSVLYSIVSALAFDVKLGSFCDAVRSNNKEVLKVIKDSLSSDFVWEVVDFNDARMEDGGVQPELRVPLLQGLMQLNELVGDSGSNQALRSTLASQLSDFFAHLESVVDSKDFQPWWSPWSGKYAVRTSLLKSGSLSVEDQIRSSKKDITSSVGHNINAERGKMFARAKRRWTVGPNHVHSPENKEKYSDPVRVRRQTDFTQLNGSTKIKKCVPTKIDSSEAEEVRSSFRKQQQFADHFHKTVQSERSRLIR
jgi:hypothetical protein